MSFFAQVLCRPPPLRWSGLLSAIVDGKLYACLSGGVVTPGTILRPPLVFVVHRSSSAVAQDMLALLLVPLLLLEGLKLLRSLLKIMPAFAVHPVLRATPMIGRVVLVLLLCLVFICTLVDVVPPLARGTRNKHVHYPAQALINAELISSCRSVVAIQVVDRMEALSLLLTSVLSFLRQLMASSISHVGRLMTPIQRTSSTAPRGPRLAIRSVRTACATDGVAEVGT
ncbi:hypothetical protein [Crucivirus-458]|nr:hypothetical protein [Crucivirus-458]